ncbi:OmpH family outer membrane protein [Thiospirochaeta perfilievii]|uniref:OmpH family outer membrane protein n=1 Tax=Thiospirochaeta perfilievii TaxID=252967 RepID=A0A5C1Q8Q8_9SPIO|nr:OmpH family outer membrane protein [Thiospirochaeta perfilievii]QEN03266.1 OmpH family outer membrane protein [Thiospirochaeta perfilievii]
MKNRVFITILILISFNISANDITKVGIVNVNEVYTRFIKESADVRKFDELKRSIQEEISKRKIEIDQIDKELIEARDDDNQELVVELESELQIKKINLQEYTKYKNRDLNARISSDATKSDFADKLQEAIQSVGLKNGYSVIFQKTDPNLLWFQPDVEITELVIQELMN